MKKRMNEVIKIELTEEDVFLFREFREHQNTFTILLKAGVFKVCDGSVTLSFDHSGTLADIKLNVVGYKRGRSVINSII